ncbi:MAG: hypothetical protein KC519_22695, partial [Anaerolineae bacterium]|nr:hypothetical protein [Anaerolineae bacterium]
QPRLADAARAGQRQEAAFRLTQQLPDGGQFSLPAHKRGRECWKIGNAHGQYLSSAFRHDGIITTRRPAKRYSRLRSTYRQSPHAAGMAVSALPGYAAHEIPNTNIRPIDERRLHNYNSDKPYFSYERIVLYLGSMTCGKHGQKNRRGDDEAR